MTVVPLLLVQDDNVFKVPMVEAEMVPCAKVVGPLDSDRIGLGQHKGFIRVWTPQDDILQALQ